MKHAFQIPVIVLVLLLGSSNSARNSPVRSSCSREMQKIQKGNLLSNIGWADVSDTCNLPDIEQPGYHFHRNTSCTYGAHKKAGFSLPSLLPQNIMLIDRPPPGTA